MSNWPDVVCVSQPGARRHWTDLCCATVWRKKKIAAKHREDERVPCVVVLSSFCAASVALVRLQIKLIPADRCACASNVVVYFLDSRSTLCDRNIYLVFALPLVVDDKL